MTFDDVRAIALELPEVEETTSYGTASFKVRKRMLCRLRDEGETLVVRVDPLEREGLLAERGAYFITPHYRDHPYVLVRLADAEPASFVSCWWRHGSRARPSGSPPSTMRSSSAVASTSFD